MLAELIVEADSKLQFHHISSRDTFSHQRPRVIFHRGAPKPKVNKVKKSVPIHSHCLVKPVDE